MLGGEGLSFKGSTVSKYNTIHLRAVGLPAKGAEEATDISDVKVLSLKEGFCLLYLR